MYPFWLTSVGEGPLDVPLWFDYGQSYKCVTIMGCTETSAPYCDVGVFSIVTYVTIVTLNNSDNAIKELMLLAVLS